MTSFFDQVVIQITTWNFFPPKRHIKVKQGSTMVLPNKTIRLNCRPTLEDRLLCLASRQASSV